MPAVKKVGTQLLLSPHVRDRARMLAIVRQESTAEVFRAALEPGLERMIRDMPAVSELEQALTAMGVGGPRLTDALEAMLGQKIRYADLFDGDGRPLTEFPGRMPNTTASG